MQGPTRQWILRVVFGGAALTAVVWSFSVRQAGADLRPVASRKLLTEFAMTDLDGNTWKLSEHRGSVVLLNFWATWCGPCREETPGIVDVANRFRARGLAVAGVSLGEDPPATVRSFAGHYRISYPILLPPPRSVLVASIESLPTTLLIDRHSRVAQTYVGAVSESTFRKSIEALLSEP